MAHGFEQMITIPFIHFLFIIHLSLYAIGRAVLRPTSLYKTPIGRAAPQPLRLYNK